MSKRAAPRRVQALTGPSKIAPILASLAIAGSAAFAQTAPGPGGPLLGRAHVWFKMGRADLGDAAADAWGVRHEDYFGLEGYRRDARDFYLGGEAGHSGAGRAVTAQGDTIRDFDFWWLELSAKKAFDLKRGLAVDIGLGGALFYVDGREVTMLGGQEVTDPLADVGFGAQGFADFTWRARRLLVGLDVKYQWAFDIINVDYSNLRLGAHLGVAF